MVAHTLHISFDQLAANPLHEVTRGQARRLNALVERRITERQPLAYLLNEAWLGPHRFYVDERAIVPRSFIAHWLLEAGSPWIAQSRRVRRVLDLCTGSGCLAILAALAFPRALVEAVDISRESLQVARRNIRAYALSGRVRLHRGDLFEPLAERRYDLIVANPPYVDRRAMRRLTPEYAAEPAVALEAGSDGLRVISRILAQAQAHLERRGLLVMEVGRNRRRIEARYPRLSLIWLENEAAHDMMLLARHSDLGACAARVSARAATG